MNKWKLVIIGHSQYPMGVKQALQFVANFNEITTFFIDDDHDINLLKKELEQFLKNNPQTLIVADLIGGSPHQIAIQLLQNPEFFEVLVLGGAGLSQIMNLGFAIFFKHELTYIQLKQLIKTDLNQLKKYTTMHAKE